MPPTATNGWYALAVPIGALISVALVVGLLRGGSREYFSER
jgi:hypothetical protein